MWVSPSVSEDIHNFLSLLQSDLSGLHRWSTLESRFSFLALSLFSLSVGPHAARLYLARALGTLDCQSAPGKACREYVLQNCGSSAPLRDWQMQLMILSKVSFVSVSFLPADSDPGITVAVATFLAASMQGWK